MHTQQSDKREIQEHQLAVIDKGDKPRTNDTSRGGSNKSLHQNSQQQNNN